MPVAVISDIHGNLPALRAVVEDIRRFSATAIVSCGDNVSGPMPAETIEYLEALDIPFQSIQGNADRGAVLSYDGQADTDEVHEDDLWSESSWR